jgi:hypothetical protein
MTKVLNSNETYVRLLDAAGNRINLSSGSVPVSGTFAASNLKVNDSDVGELNPVHVALVSPSTIAVTDNNSSLTVDATDLDIRAIDYATDAIKALPQTNDAVLFNNILTENDSASIDSLYCRLISFVGEVDGAITFSIEVSTDNTQFYASGSQIIVSGAGEFHANFETAFRYVRLAPSIDTVTATIIGACM